MVDAVKGLKRWHLVMFLSCPGMLLLLQELLFLLAAYKHST